MAVLVASVESRTRILSSVRGMTDVELCERCEELMPVLRRTLVDAVLVEPWDSHGVAASMTVRELRGAFPSVPVIMYCRLDHQSMREIVELTRAGADELVLRGVDDVRGVLQGLLVATSIRRAAAQALEYLLPDVSAGVLPLLSYCLHHAGDRVHVRSVADALGVDRRTLVNRLASLGLPGPAALISWSRLILAARLLEDPGRSVEQAAYALNFGSAPALRNMLRRYTGLRPAEVRRGGGMRCVLDLLRRRLRSARAPSVRWRHRAHERSVG